MITTTATVPASTTTATIMASTKKLQHHRDLQNSRIQKNRKETTEESRSWRKKFSV